MHVFSTYRFYSLWKPRYFSSLNDLQRRSDWRPFCCFIGRPPLISTTVDFLLLESLWTVKGHSIRRFTRSPVSSRWLLGAPTPSARQPPRYGRDRFYSASSTANEWHKGGTKTAKSEKREITKAFLKRDQNETRVFSNDHSAFFSQLRLRFPLKTSSCSLTTRSLQLEFSNGLLRWLQIAIGGNGCSYLP